MTSSDQTTERIGPKDIAELVFLLTDSNELMYLLHCLTEGGNNPIPGDVIVSIIKGLPNSDSERINKTVREVNIDESLRLELAQGLYAKLVKWKLEEKEDYPIHAFVCINGFDEDVEFYVTLPLDRILKLEGK